MCKKGKENPCQERCEECEVILETIESGNETHTFMDHSAYTWCNRTKCGSPFRILERLDRGEEFKKGCLQGNYFLLGSKKIFFHLSKVFQESDNAKKIIQESNF